ncbi:hypothetical protein KBX35_15460 [Micromonospora sp. C32]|uniref:hypothetical protein n=1 Tax=unclassified Micromonospora TaxID=2617518 RepID=UPI001B394CC9|nr:MULTISPECIES: hypothetical protein [unclassified Micromonospora]MBQ1042280.1 hypothetical protein [Micromonospora sp. C72]MBQ1056184.1 hypothetical protein [Micromonospora sp. C32]
MTDHRSASGPHATDRPSEDTLGRVPEWLRQPAPEVEPGRGDRLRIALGGHSGKLLGGVVALALLAFFGLVGGLGYQGFQRWREPPAEHPTVSLPVGEQASSSASPPPAAGPFDGTPAAGFPEGAAGIALPRAKRTGAFSEKQVADTLAKVRKALITARLDRTFFTAKDPERLVRQFAPDARAGVRDDFPTGEAGTYATRLAPGARLTDDQPRVKGRISYRATKDRDGIRILEVTTNFVWAYAFPTTSPTPGDGVVVVHDTVKWSSPHPADVTAASAGLWIERADSYASNIDCAALDKGLLALGKPSFGGPADPDPDAVFDPDKTVDLPDTC